MSRDPLFAAQINRPRPELAFHDPEGFFDLPAPAADFQNTLGVVFKIGGDGIEAVVAGFFKKAFFIHRINPLIGLPPVPGLRPFNDKPFGVALPVSVQPARRFY